MNERRSAWLLVAVLFAQLIVLSLQAPAEGVGNNLLESAVLRLVMPLARGVDAAAGGASGLAERFSRQQHLVAENRGETYLMPDLIDHDVREVRRFFEGHGFRIGSVKYEPYEGIRDPVVLRQYPLPGHPLRHGEVISLVVAAAPELGGAA